MFWSLIPICFVLWTLAVGAARFYQIRGDVRRRESARTAWEFQRAEERSRKRETAVLREVESCFPFVCDAVRSRLRAGEKPSEAIRGALEEIPGIRIGKTRKGGFPVVVTTASRPTHLAAFGRTGSGKSTLAMTLLNVDAHDDVGVLVVTAEAEFARDHVLPRVPLERDTVCVSFTDPRCPIVWNLFELEPGDPPERAAGEFFAAFKRSVQALSLGPRTDAIARNAFAALIGIPGTTLLSIRQLLENETYRAGIVAHLKDENCRDFWARIYPSYPPAARLPILTRLESFTANPALRRVLCGPRSTWSLREALAKKKVIIFDLSGLPPDDVMLLGQLILAILQLEIMHRESVPEAERPLTVVYLDEFHEFSANAEGTFRQLLSKGRRYRVSVNAFTQHPNQLSRSLQDEVFGNVATLACLAVGAKDAARLKRELLVLNAEGVRVPVDADVLQTQAVGEAVIRLGTGCCAVETTLDPPLPKASVDHGVRVRENSWSKYGSTVEVPAAAESESRIEGAGETAMPAANGLLPGRGGQQHKMLQAWARRLAEEQGFRVNLEEDVLDGAGRVDLVLRRAEVRVAVEVSITSSPAEVAETVNKCAATGFEHIVVIATNDSALRRAERATLEVLPSKDRTKVQFLMPDALRSFLDTLSEPADATGRTLGYTVHVETPGSESVPHKQQVARLVGTALLRRRASS